MAAEARRGSKFDRHLGIYGSSLHVICKSSCKYNDNLVEVLFRVNDELNRRLKVRIDAKDGLGRTPLYLALERGHRKLTETLLRRGADTSSASMKGSTPLHWIFINYFDYDLADVFLRIIDGGQKVSIDAKDEMGRTPLERAAARLSPKTDHVLLDHGAKLSKFVFPGASHLDEGVKLNNGINVKVTSGILAVVERLEAKGYELD